MRLLFLFVAALLGLAASQNCTCCDLPGDLVTTPSQCIDYGYSNSVVDGQCLSQKGTTAFDACYSALTGSCVPYCTFRDAFDPERGAPCPDYYQICYVDALDQCIRSVSLTESFEQCTNLANQCILSNCPRFYFNERPCPGNGEFVLATQCFPLFGACNIIYADL